MQLRIDGWYEPATGAWDAGTLLDVGDLPDPVATGWRAIDSPLPEQHAWVHRTRRLLALLGASTHRDGRIWIHVSVRHAARIPTWDEFVFAKDSLLGDRRAIQVFPPRAEWVNIHPHVLHLWACVGDDGLPTFAEHGSI